VFPDIQSLVRCVWLYISLKRHIPVYVFTCKVTTVVCHPIYNLTPTEFNFEQTNKTEIDTVINFIPYSARIETS